VWIVLLKLHFRHPTCFYEISHFHFVFAFVCAYWIPNFKTSCFYTILSSTICLLPCVCSCRCLHTGTNAAVHWSSFCTGFECTRNWMAIYLWSRDDVTTKRYACYRYKQSECVQTTVEWRASCMLIIMSLPMMKVFMLINDNVDLPHQRPYVRKSVNLVHCEYVWRSIHNLYNITIVVAGLGAAL